MMTAGAISMFSQILIHIFKKFVFSSLSTFLLEAVDDSHGKIVQNDSINLLNLDQQQGHSNFAETSNDIASNEDIFSVESASFNSPLNQQRLVHQQRKNAWQAPMASNNSFMDWIDAPPKDTAGHMMNLQAEQPHSNRFQSIDLCATPETVKSHGEILAEIQRECEEIESRHSSASVGTDSSMCTLSPFTLTTSPDSTSAMTLAVQQSESEQHLLDSHAIVKTRRTKTCRRVSNPTMKNEANQEPEAVNSVEALSNVRYSNFYYNVEFIDTK